MTQYYYKLILSSKNWFLWFPLNCCLEMGRGVGGARLIWPGISYPEDLHSIHFLQEMHGEQKQNFWYDSWWYVVVILIPEHNNFISSWQAIVAWYVSQHEWCFFMVKLILSCRQKYEPRSKCLIVDIYPEYSSHKLQNAIITNTFSMSMRMLKESRVMEHAVASLLAHRNPHSTTIS